MEKESNIRIDFIFSFSSYERQAITRAKEVKLGRTFVRFASLEDVIIHKIVSGRPRDLEDIKSILIKNPNYDSNYISAWLEEFDQSLKENFGKRFKEHEETIK